MVPDIKTIVSEMKSHAGFTAFGSITAIVIIAIMFQLKISEAISSSLFWFFHPFHVIVSAWATTAMYLKYSKGANILRAIIIGYIGSVGIATLSDSIIPYAGEVLLNLPHADIHIGVIEKWWIINPMAAIGILAGFFLTGTKMPHYTHVLLSTWASMFHMTMAMGDSFSSTILVLVTTFLFLAVWLPCCMSDIIFPLLFKQDTNE